MDAFKQTKFTRIEGNFSSARRMPRLGKIKLGIKVEKKRKDNTTVQYPKETDYFVCPPEVRAIYGEQPKELDVMLPSDDPEVCFPQKLSAFGSSKGLRCHGNGVKAERYNEDLKVWQERECPCDWLKSDQNPEGICTPKAYLMALLPRVSLGGVYQIQTGSYNSVVDINSSFELIRYMVNRIALVPLKLRRVERETHRDGKKQKHWTLELILDADAAGINKLREVTDRILERARYQIEAPHETNPLLEGPDVIEAETEEPDDETRGGRAGKPAPGAPGAESTAGPPTDGPAAARPGAGAAESRASAAGGQAGVVTGSASPHPSSDMGQNRPAQATQSAQEQPNEADPMPGQDLDLETLLGEFCQRIEAAQTIKEVSEVVNEGLEQEGFRAEHRKRLIDAQNGWKERHLPQKGKKK